MAIELEVLEKLAILTLLVIFSSTGAVTYILYSRYRKSIFGNILLLLFISLILLTFYFSTGSLVSGWFSIFVNELALLHEIVEIIASILWVGLAYFLYVYTKRISE